MNSQIIQMTSQDIQTFAYLVTQASLIAGVIGAMALWILRELIIFIGDIINHFYKRKPNYCFMVMNKDNAGWLEYWSKGSQLEACIYVNHVMTEHFKELHIQTDTKSAKDLKGFNF